MRAQGGDRGRQPGPSPPGVWHGGDLWDRTSAGELALLPSESQIRGTWLLLLCSLSCKFSLTATCVCHNLFEYPSAFRSSEPLFGGGSPRNH